MIDGDQLVIIQGIIKSHVNMKTRIDTHSLCDTHNAISFFKYSIFI